MIRNSYWSHHKLSCLDIWNSLVMSSCKLYTLWYDHHFPFSCDSLWRCSTPSCFCFFSMLLSSHSHMQSCLWYQFLTPNFIGQIMLIWMLWVSMVMMNWMILIKRSKACQKEQLKTVRRQIQKVWICRVSLSIIQLITCLKFQGAQVYLVYQIN